MATADRKFADLLGKGVTEIRTIIATFTSMDPRDIYDRFFTLATNMPFVDFIDDGAQITVSGAKKNIVGSPMAVTAAGIMYRSKLTNEIYKKIRIDVDEDDLITFFLEAFIAVVLSTHPMVGGNICVPTRAFKNAGIARKSGRVADSGASAQQVDAPSLYLLMDVIPYNYKSWATRRPAGRSMLQHYLPIIRQISIILAALENDFRYCHNDLHAENFLITEGGEVKLIDFGRSSVRFNGNYYGHRRDNFTQPAFEFSCDMLTFLVSMYTATGNAELRAFIRALFTHPVDGLNLLDMIQGLSESQPRDSAGRSVPLHWLCYPYEVWGYENRYGGWSDALKQRLRETPNCCRPANLAEVLVAGPFAPPRPPIRANEERLPLVQGKSCWQCIKNGFSSMCCGTRRRKGGRRHFKRTTRRKMKSRR